VGAHIHLPPLRKAASYSFIIRVVAVEEQFPAGPAKGDAAAQFPQIFPTRMIRSRGQIVFECGWCSFLFARHPPGIRFSSATSMRDLAIFHYTTNLVTIGRAFKEW
jgi:hypothetical protein